MVGDVSTESREEEERKKKVKKCMRRGGKFQMWRRALCGVEMRGCVQSTQHHPNSSIHRPGTSVSGLSLIRNNWNPRGVLGNAPPCSPSYQSTAKLAANQTPTWNETLTSTPYFDIFALRNRPVIQRLHLPTIQLVCRSTNTSPSPTLPFSIHIYSVFA